MGTYGKDQTRIDKPKGIKKILKRWKPKLSRKKMLEECDVYIYDIHFDDMKDIQYGMSIFDNVNLEEQKIFILVSDLIVWSNTPKKIKEKKAEEKPADEENKDGEIPPENEEKKEENEGQQQANEEGNENQEANADEQGNEQEGEAENQQEQEQEQV